MASPRQLSYNSENSSYDSNNLIYNSENYSESSEDSEQKITVFFKLRKMISLSVKKSETVRNVKRMLREKEGISEYVQELYFSGVLLKDEYRLDDCGIEKNSSLHLFVKKFEIIKIFVSIRSKNKTIDVEAKVHDTILNIKSMIQAREGIKTDDFTLFHAGIPLEDNEALTSLGIMGESILHLVFNPKDMVNLTAKIARGEIVKTQVKVLYTVGDVKAIVESIVGYSLGAYNVISDGKKLDDSNTLSFYNIKGESVLDIKLPAIPIFVKHCSGKTISLYICPHETVLDVKNMICSKLDEPIDLGISYFAFAGKLLVNDRDLASYGIERNSTLHMLLRSRSCVHPMTLAEIEASGYGGVTLSMKICSLKMIIADMVQQPVQDVLLGGQALKDEYCLSIYGVKKNTLFSVLYS